MRRLRVELNQHGYTGAKDVADSVTGAFDMAAGKIKKNYSTRFFF
jgi:hypothetical protein